MWRLIVKITPIYTNFLFSLWDLVLQVLANLFDLIDSVLGILSVLYCIHLL